MDAPPYATVAEADAYHAARASAATWAAIDDEDKPKLLLSASDYIDVAYQYKGVKTDPDRVREFPRNGSTEIPRNVKYACCELALTASETSLTENAELEETEVKVDVIEVKYADSSSNRLSFGTGVSDYVDMLLRPFLATSRLGIGESRMLRG